VNAEIQCSKGFKGSVGSPGNSDSFEDASEVSDVACDDGQMCAMFEVEEMDQESKKAKDVKLLGCMEKEKCEAIKETVEDNDLQNFQSILNENSLDYYGGEIKGACCNFGELCNKDAELSKMIELQEEHEKKIASSGIKVASKVFTVFAACSFTMIFF